MATIRVKPSHLLEIHMLQGFQAKQLMSFLATAIERDKNKLRIAKPASW